MRNGFDLIKAFYSWVFNNQALLINTNHIALYMFFVNQNNRNHWVDWFKCPYDLAMIGSCIRNKKTYYKTLNELVNWGLIGYIPGQSMHKSPLFSLTEIPLKKDDKNVPNSEVVGLQNDPQPVTPPVTQPVTQHYPQPVTPPVTPHDTLYKTFNVNTFKRVTGNSEIENFDKFSDTDSNQENTSDSPTFLRAEERQKIKVAPEPDNPEILEPELWPTFNDFWEAYDKKRGKIEKLKKKWESLKQSEKEKILEYIPHYKTAQPDKNFRKDPQTFLNNKSWNDEIITAKSNNFLQSNPNQPNHFARLLDKVNRSTSGR